MLLNIPIPLITEFNNSSSHFLVEKVKEEKNKAPKKIMKRGQVVPDLEHMINTKEN